ncbi:NUDIX hydrolase [Oceanobacillus halophilus]|uniref:NUDIX domain-containing protein n=1 Tax=Oceanobacillus halophilus TaxID=930130 RepID=A0A495A0Y4_9BACI|nr:NUDIX hydrolase [Oceanobacillus halophilus]RKQ32938.1 NUDIX domain-containing protein [Oceanobacillus halophilus]
MDVVFRTEQGTFNFRVAGVYIENNHILIHKDVNDTSWSLPGGRVKISEVSIESLKREFQEELNWDIQVSQLHWIVENFFTYHSANFHEIGFYYRVKAVGEKFHKEPFFGKEGNRLLYQWVSIDEIQNIELMPTFLSSALKHIPEHTVHFVTEKYD